MVAHTSYADKFAICEWIKYLPWVREIVECLSVVKEDISESCTQDNADFNI